MAQIKSLSWRLRNLEPTQDNLHLIAISNIQDPEHALRRWWSKKYRKPFKEYEDHTLEELLLEQLEDYYAANPSEISRFLDQLNATENVEEWNGELGDEYERRMKAKWSRKRQVDLEKYQSDEELTEEDEQRIIDSLGRNLPKSRTSKLDEGEFEEAFLGDDE